MYSHRRTDSTNSILGEVSSLILNKLYTINIEYKTGAELISMRMTLMAVQEGYEIAYASARNKSY